MKILTQCCDCLKYEWDKNDWRKESPDPDNENISHTYCPECFKKAKDEIDKL